MLGQYEGKELKLYVYSTDLDNCREVLVTPHRGWGGEGRYVKSLIYHKPSTSLAIVCVITAILPSHYRGDQTNKDNIEGSEDEHSAELRSTKTLTHTLMHTGPFHPPKLHTHLILFA